MNNEKLIQRFIQKAIKTDGEEDEGELVCLLNGMTTVEVQLFWGGFSSTLALRQTDATIPHWKTSRQKDYFLRLTREYGYQPKEKDINGKPIVDRTDLINHVKKHVLNHIQHEIQLNRDFKNQTLLEKIPFYIFVSIMVSLPFFMIASIFSDNKVSQFIITSFIILYGGGIILNPIIHLIIKRKKRKQLGL